MAAFSVVGCGDGDPGSPEEGIGSLRAAIDLAGERHDVTAVRLDIVPPDAACDAEPISSETVGLEEEPLPGSLAGSGSHAFGDRRPKSS